jgi:hypothetical protein
MCDDSTDFVRHVYEFINIECACSIIIYILIDAASLKTKVNFSIIKKCPTIYRKFDIQTTGRIRKVKVALAFLLERCTRLFRYKRPSALAECILHKTAHKVACCIKSNLGCIMSCFSRYIMAFPFYAVHAGYPWWFTYRKMKSDVPGCWASSFSNTKAIKPRQ